MHAPHSQAVIDLRAAFLVFDDAGILEHRQVARHGGHIDADHFGQFADAPFAVLRQFIDDEQPGGMGHRLDDLGTGFVLGLRLCVHRCVSYRLGLFGSLAKCPCDCQGQFNIAQVR